MGYALDHLLAIAGTGLAIYFLWSMILDPAKGPLSGTIIPLAVGIVGFVVTVLAAAWGLNNIYSPRGSTRS